MPDASDMKKAVQKDRPVISQHELSRSERTVVVSLVLGDIAI